jgi:predicted transcriptional regulator
MANNGASDGAKTGSLDWVGDSRWERPDERFRKHGISQVPVGAESKVVRTLTRGAYLSILSQSEIITSRRSF